MQVEKLFGCLRAGVVKRRERKLEELWAAGCPGWVIEEWKGK